MAFFCKILAYQFYERLGLSIKGISVITRIGGGELMHRIFDCQPSRASLNMQVTA